MVFEDDAFLQISYPLASCIIIIKRSNSLALKFCYKTQFLESKMGHKELLMEIRQTTLNADETYLFKHVSSVKEMNFECFFTWFLSFKNKVSEKH